MASTAADISVIDADYTGSPPRRSLPRLRPLRFRSPAAAHSNILTFEAALHSGFASSISTPAGSDTTTRILNIAVAAVALLIAAPLFLIIALAIKLAGRGPVFYKQIRVGIDRRWNMGESHADVRVQDLGGRPFTMYKFRTMVVTAETDGEELWATPRDPRVTAVGRFLRASRLDELPQLLNVLAGDMNIVGPRPERPGIFAELRNEIPNYHLRQRVMPGITGWAQVNQSYDTCVSDVRRKVAYDLEYLGTRSVVRDLSIMARTIPIMLLCRFGW